MNKLKAKVSSIECEGILHLVEFEYGSSILSMVSLELMQDICIGTSVLLGIKPTQIAIAKSECALSYSNRLNAKIISISVGKIVSSVQSMINDTILESIITTKSLKRLNIKVNDEIILLIKATDLSISEVIND